MGSKGTNTTTSTSAPNPQAYAAYSDLLNRAQGVAATPYTPYTGELVAPLNAQQNAGIANINAAQPAFSDAVTMARNAAQPITTAQIQQYQSPYTQDVIDATQRQFNNQNAQAAQGVNSQAVAQGALGGNRIGVAQAELSNQQQLAQAPVIASLRDRGYATGLNTALTQQQALAQGAYGVASAGQSRLAGAGAQIGAGSLQQQTQQAKNAADYQQFVNAQAYPFQTAQWLAGIDSGIGSQMGGTSSTTAPAPSALGGLLGLGTAGMGLLGSSGLLSGLGGGAAAGAGAAGSAAAGGLGGAAAGAGAGLAEFAPMLMAAFASGGAVRSEGVANREPTIPETDDTLRAQQNQLTNGHRRVQMFPSGTPELPVPHGMQRTENENGVFHYDPRRIDENEIHHLSARGRENEFLDLGPYSKDDILHRLRGGEIPIAVVERHPDGTEVRAAAGTHTTAHHQMAAMHRTKSPGNRVQIEDPRETIGARMRGGGGRIQGFAGGGDVPQPGAFDMSAAPWSGGHSWVPSMAMTRGAGAPKAPGVAPTTQDLAKQAGQIGSLAKLINGGPSQGQNGLDTDAANNGSGIYTGPASIPGFAAGNPGQMQGAGLSAGLENPSPFHRGGMALAHGGVAPHGYADGGSPYGEDYFDAAFASPIQRTPAMYEIAANPGAMADYTARARDIALENNPGAVPLPRPRPAGLAPAAGLPPEITAGASVPVDGPGLGYNGSAPSSYVPVIKGDNQPSPLDDAPWPQGPRGAPGSGFDAEAAGSDGHSAVDAAPARGVAPSGIDWSEKGKLWPALMAAGFGMMASKSPHPGVAIGEGGLAGVGAYTHAVQQENQNKLSERKIDLEVKNLQQRADIAGRPYKEMTKAQQGSLDEQRQYHRDLTARMQLRPTGTMTAEGHPIFTDARTGQSIDSITGEPVDSSVAVKPMPGKAGAVEHLAQTLVDQREKERKDNPGLPPLSFEEATAIAHKAPNADAGTMRRLALAQSAWRAWQGNPLNFGKKDAPESKLEFWEKRYATDPATAAPAAPGAKPPPASAPGAAAPAKPAPEPPRPASVPPEAKLQRNKTDPSRYRWVAPDGSIYSADGAKQ